MLIVLIYSESGLLLSSYSWMAFYLISIKKIFLSLRSSKNNLFNFYLEKLFEKFSQLGKEK